MHKRLLPIGFYDLNSSEAKRSYDFTKFAIDYFINNDYELIKTSIIEFEENFDHRHLANVFKAIDPISRKNIFFRSDITVQISKYIASLDQEIVKPLKLCYFGEVLTTGGEELYHERQQTQLGCEIIGSSDEGSSNDVIADTIKVLHNVENLNITISLPDFLDIFLSALADINPLELATNLREAIIYKRITDVKNYAPNHSKIISEIILNNSDFEYLDDQIRKQFSDKKILESLGVAKKLMLFVKSNFKNLSINFDLFGDNKFSYHNKIAFDIFANDFRYPIARGGCYSIVKNNKLIDAVGSTIYVNSLRKFEY